MYSSASGFETCVVKRLAAMMWRALRQHLRCVVQLSRKTRSLVVGVSASETGANRYWGGLTGMRVNQVLDGDVRCVPYTRTVHGVPEQTTQNPRKA